MITRIGYGPKVGQKQTKQQRYGQENLNEPLV